MQNTQEGEENQLEENANPNKSFFFLGGGFEETLFSSIIFKASVSTTNSDTQLNSLLI